MLAVVASALVISPQTLPTWADVEQKKFTAFTNLVGFAGTYDVASVPAEGAGFRQEVSYAFSPVARRMRVMVNGSAKLESAWTRDRKWVVYYAERKYSLVSAPGKIALTPPYQPLAVAPGSANFTVDDHGVRFASDPAPVVKSVEKETVEGATLRKITAEAKNSQTGGEMKVVQWFDGDGWIVRKFEITLISKGKTLMTIKGSLKGDKLGEVFDPRVFDLPANVVENFTKIS